MLLEAFILLILFSHGNANADHAATTGAPRVVPCHIVVARWPIPRHDTTLFLAKMQILQTQGLVPEMHDMNSCNINKPVLRDSVI